MRAGETPPEEVYDHETPISPPKNKKYNTKKRFTSEQIKLLESIFNLETRLDPRKKVQVATDLGLQPRQVAIWFQNRRARWKSKHLETEYGELRAKFDCLQLQFQALKEEKEFLLKELEPLRNLTTNQNVEENGSKDVDDGNNSSPVDAHATHSSFELSNNSEDKAKNESFEFGDYVDKSLCSSEEWSNLDIGGLFSQSSDTSKWWDF